MSAIISVAWSPNEQKVALVSTQGVSSQAEVFIFDPMTGRKLLSYIQGSNNFYFSHALEVAWSPDGKYLGTSGSDMAQITDPNSGQRVAKYPQGGPNTSRAFAWSPDGQMAVSSASQAGHSLQLWSTQTGAAIKYYPANFPNSIAWSPDGKYIAYEDIKQQIYIWNVKQDQLVLTIPGQLDPNLNGIFDEIHAHAIAWSPNSTELAVTSYENAVHIWNVNTKQQSYTYTEHSAPARAVAWSPDGQQIASAGDDHTVRIWQAV
ncbi:WD40 repeat domain-containing protein [Dictyobacter kobayashii]|uniref:WD40 repeat domain-containing protein n=1 Tax=Dictyobacter kobayashii TaxID=2014872 RepID=UPI000F83FF71|nr:DPP IV N-terminal domain-containing protein [Dictyobacter kobayashii]